MGGGPHNAEATNVRDQRGNIGNSGSTIFVNAWTYCSDGFLNDLGLNGSEKSTATGSVLIVAAIARKPAQICSNSAGLVFRGWVSTRRRLGNRSAPLPQIQK